MSDLSDNGGTTSTDYRWKYIATLVTLILILSLVVLLIGGGAGIISLNAIPQGWFITYSLLLTAAGTWLFGVEIVDYYKK